MQKMVVQQGQAANQPAARQRKGPAVESPQGEQIAQLEAMAESSPQADKLAQLAAMADASPALATQRRFTDMIHNSPAMAAQGKTIEGIHGSPHITAQRQEADESLQAQTAQRAETPAKPNHTGLPDNLKSGIESLSGLSMDNVRVHYNSSQPAQLNALAYAQGTDIHVAPGQEQHLPHEAWHVVQQAQGRVKPTMQMKEGVPVNDDKGLEHEADVMGARAIQGKMQHSNLNPVTSVLGCGLPSVQLNSIRSMSTSKVTQLNFKVKGTLYDKKSQLPEIIDKIVEVTKKPKKQILPFSGKIAGLIEGDLVEFGDYVELYDFLAPPLEKKESEYVGKTAPPEPIGKSSIALFRAMSEAEGGALESSGNFAMYVGKNQEESGIKFFATDINYSIGLANKKNDEAYLKRQETLPYERMVGAVIDKEEVAFGLEEDVGIHKDNKHTENFLREESGDVKNLSAHSEEGFKQVARGENYAEDTPDRGYVLKHESGGLNFGVKAKTKENTKPHWKSPIEYFNSLVKWAGFLGRFVMKSVG